MKLMMEYNNHSVKVEAESLIEAIIDIIDFDDDITSDTEFIIRVVKGDSPQLHL